MSAVSLRTAAQSFLLEVKAVKLAGALERAGVEPVLLKGPAFSRLLYGSIRERPYHDIDLLIDPALFERARGVVVGEGFEPFEPEAMARQTDAAVALAAGAAGSAHAEVWVRRADNFMLDLHDSLPQIPVPPADVWRALRPHTTSIGLGGGAMRTLDGAATALLVTLHAAHHGPQWIRSAVDLERALERFEPVRWGEALELARELRCVSAFGIGLGFTERGRAVAAALSLATEPTAAYELLWRELPWTAHVIAAIRAEGSWRARVTLALKVTFPSPDAMRRGASLARGGLPGLLAAYLVRFVRVTVKALEAIRER